MHRISRTAVTLAALAALVGCTPPGESPAEATEPTSAAAGAAGPEPEEAEPVDDPSREDLHDEHALEWEDARVIAPDAIRVEVPAGTERCYGLRSIVEEDGSTVRIAVMQGLLPDAPAACTMELRRASMLVRTAEPVGDREILPLEDPEPR